MQRIFCIVMFYILFVIPSLQKLVCIKYSQHTSDQANCISSVHVAGGYPIGQHSLCHTAWVRIPALTHRLCVCRQVT